MKKRNESKSIIYKLGGASDLKARSNLNSVSPILHKFGGISNIKASFYFTRLAQIFNFQFSIFNFLLLLLTSCSSFDYHPYDVDISGTTGINARNMERIEAQCASKDTLRIAFTGDTQGWNDETIDMVEDINRRSNIDFLVHGGDLTDYGMTKEFIWQRDILEKLNIPYVVIIGNHDCLGTGRSAFHKIFGDANFSFIAARIKFVCLNTNAMEYDYSYAIPDFDYMLQQTKEDSTQFDRTVVCMHAGPYSDEFNNNVAQPFEFYVRMYPGLLFCTMAHDHHFRVEELYDDGVTYFTTDCAKNRAYLLITITNDGFSYERITY